jgi:hypothetical protein
MKWGQAEWLDREGFWADASNVGENYGLLLLVDSKASGMPGFWLSRRFIWEIAVNVTCNRNRGQ